MDITENDETETFKTASLILYRALQDIGISTCNTSDLSQLGLLNCYELISKLATQCYADSDDLEYKTSGSAIEGSHVLDVLNGFKYDIDLIIVPKHCFAYETIPTSLSSSIHQLQIHYNTENKGYVTLELKNEGSSFYFPKTFFPMSELCVSRQNRTYLSSLLFTHRLEREIFSRKSKLGIMTHNLNEMRSSVDMNFQGTHVVGPSVATDITGNGFLEFIEKVDNVLTIKCPEWPSVANEWISRQRQHNWPPINFIEEHKKHGAEVVPAGCRVRPQEGLEWRLSFNDTEKALIRLFNETQFKCYTCLKSLMKRYIKPNTEVLTSYIVKTTMFWLIEETPSTLWVPRNLFQCILMCLNRILQQIIDSHCPHYFIRDRNIFNGQYDLEGKSVLVKLFLDVMRNLWGRLLSVTPFLNPATPEIRPREGLLHIYPQLKTIAKHHQSIFTQTLILNCVMSVKSGQTLSAVLRVFEHFVQRVRSVIKTNKTLEEINSDYFINILFKHQTLALMEQLQINPENRRNITPAIQTLRQLSRKQGGISEKVLTAQMLYLLGNYQEASQMLSELCAEDLLKTYIRINDSEQLIDIILATGDSIATSLSNTGSIYDLYFLLVESPWLPEPLQKELEIRANSLDSRRTGSHDGDVSVFVVVDPLVFGCYLKFQCSRNLGNDIAALEDITKIEMCCAIESIQYKDIAYTLLGHCYSCLDEHGHAYRSYEKALRENSNNKASKWYIDRIENRIHE